MKNFLNGRIKKIVSRMTLDEKLDQLGGDSLFTTPGLIRLSIPPFKMSDGPCGVRTFNGKSTCFPSTLALAATWDPKLAYNMGKGLGADFIANNLNVCLGPCINLVRDPRWGRTFETLGEDPHLAARIGTSLIKGIQSQKVISVLKHFACNNHENNRYQHDIDIDDYIMHNLYLKHFYDCVKYAGPWGIMSAYNKVNGTFCSQNSYLLRVILKSNWKFKGFVVSDWSACHCGVESLKSGLDLEMPNAKYLGPNLKPDVLSGVLKEELIDEAVERILMAKLWAAKTKKSKKFIPPDTHKKISFEIALHSCVLLKNANNILPIENNSPLTIGVIGPLADYTPVSGGGSGEVNPHYTVSILEGIKSAAGKEHNILFAKGCYMNPGDCLLDQSEYKLNYAEKPGFKASFFKNNGSTPLLERIDKDIQYSWNTENTKLGNIFNGIRAKWKSELTFFKSGRFAIGAVSNGNLKIIIDNKVIYNSPDIIEVAKPRYAEFDFVCGQNYTLEIEYSFADCFFSEISFFIADFNSQFLLKSALETACKSDINIICLGTDKYIETESRDRDSLSLPSNQVELLNQLCKASSKNIVVLTCGSAVNMDWCDKVQGIFHSWFNGQEKGNAVASLIFGKHSPSGRLPLSIPANTNELTISNTDYNKNSGAIGYRFYEISGKAPLYEFGYGLSYTKFEYSNFELCVSNCHNKKQVSARFTLTNTGDRAGYEVVQLYIQNAACEQKGYKDLRAFKKVYLKPGQSKHIHFRLNRNALAYYDAANGNYSKLHDEYLIQIGSSSKDMLLTKRFVLTRKP